jgi:hypothetical protein
MVPNGFQRTSETTFIGSTAVTTNGPTSYTYEARRGPQTQGFVAAFEVRGGLMLSPRFGVLVNVAFASHVWLDAPEAPKPVPQAEVKENESGDAIWQGHVGISAQYFVLDRLWLRGGAGVGVLHYNSQFNAQDSQSEAKGASLLVGAGYEVFHAANPRHNHGLSLELTAVTVPGGDNSAWLVDAGVGYQWY